GCAACALPRTRRPSSPACSNDVVPQVGRAQGDVDRVRKRFRTALQSTIATSSLRLSHDLQIMGRVLEPGGILHDQCELLLGAREIARGEVREREVVAGVPMGRVDGEGILAIAYRGTVIAL